MEENQRYLHDWLSKYVEFTDNDEPLPLLRKWCGISVIAAVLQRKTWFKHGSNAVIWYPNLNVVLVSPPGIGRKTTAIRQARPFLTDPDCHIVLSANSQTKESLIEDIKGAATTIDMDKVIDGKFVEKYTHSSLTILSGELTVFLGYQNLPLMTDLTEWYDCDDPWINKTKNKGVDIIRYPWVNMLAATTTDQLRAALPREMIGSGFSSRLLYIFVEDHNPITDPEPTPEQLALEEKLHHDLHVIAQLCGPFTRDMSFKEVYDPWYRFRQGHTTFDDINFRHYFERKPATVVKVACILCASRSNDMIVTGQDFLRALNIVEEAEVHMPKALGGIGKADHAEIMPRIAADIALHKRVTIQYLYERYKSEGTRVEIAEVVAHLESFDYCKFATVSGYIIYNRNFKPPQIPKDMEE